MQQPPAASDAATPDCYILVVEDNEVDEYLVSRPLLRSGFRVVTATGGREALACLRANPPPCLILVDVGLPDIDGFYFRGEQRQDPRLSDVPVVMMTGLLDQDTPSVAADAMILAKPVDPERLVELARKYCRATATQG